MASINTNVAALTALRALTATNTALEQTQNRISTGLRVNDASDNAAYWSIATTMRSDSKALSVVQDSLGLGAATVDTAYAGINSAIGIVDQIKQKLLSARGEGVDRSKIQKEITELQGQLRGIADAAVVPGAENWLSTDSSVAGYNATKSIVSSFTRTNGGVSVQTIGVDTSNIKLYDGNSTPVTGTTTGTFTAAAGTFTLSVGGNAVGTVTTTTGSTLNSIAADINALGAGITATVNGSQLAFTNNNGAAVTVNAGFATATGLTAPTLGAANTGVVYGNSTGTFAAAASGPINITVGGVNVGNFSTTTSSTLATIADDINALGIEGLTAAVNGNQLTFANRTGAAVGFSAAFSGLTGPSMAAPAPAAKGALDKAIIDTFGTGGWTSSSVTNLDISALTNSAADAATLDALIGGVDAQLGKLTDAATNLGSVKSRIGLQKDFAKSLMDTLEAGIGQLVDTDMNEESTRLQALQVKQQLGIQALSIANASSQSILSLFR